MAERGVEYQNIRDIVRKHNSIRSMAAKGEIPGHPRAVNMKSMVPPPNDIKNINLYRCVCFFQKWDARLALTAQEVADSCKIRHVLMPDGNRNTQNNIFLQ